ncbi:hypothetical protein HU200_014444 [Digitaria exilis]|uniref:Uncharacterized protein n=1 Tax=Digitaria exilis TaxID=1010633 RepID=A0A835FBZ5_9POAL|nr:hypothetical protein HU200_014444 [Digitaria exilis]
MAAALRLSAPPAVARWAPPPSPPVPASPPPPGNVSVPLAASRAAGEGRGDAGAGGGAGAVPPVVVRNDEWTWGDVFNRVYKDKAFDNIVISPGPGSPACPTDIGVLKLEHDGCYLFNSVPSGRNSGFKVVRSILLANLVPSPRICHMLKGWNSGSLTGLTYLQREPLGRSVYRLRWKKIDNFLCSTVGSEDIFAVLFGQQSGEDTFWLDSSSVDQNRARFSFMGGKGGSLWKQMTFHLSGQRTLQSIEYNEKDYEGLPFDFHGGFVGYLGYGLKVECDASSNQAKSKYS